MKTIVTTTGGIRLVGTRPETKSYIIALNVPLKDIDSETLADSMMTRYVQQDVGTTSM